MAQKIYVVEGQKFKTEQDYKQALQDKKLIDRMRELAAHYNNAQKKALIDKIRAGGYPFKTKLGLQYADELEQELPAGKTKSEMNPPKELKSKRESTSDDLIDQMARQLLQKKEARRKKLIFLFSIIGLVCLTWFGVYSYFDYKTGKNFEQLSQMKEHTTSKPDVLLPISTSEPALQGPLFTLDDQDDTKEILDEYINLYNKNKKLIGWIKIDDTNIDYPVMQTSDNSYYLDHNSNQEYDRNGSIFMDKDCDVLKPSTNYIVYGHHMASGRMFGKLGLYQDKQYFEKHKYIDFDTIYEKGIYKVMYVFRSRVYNNEDVVFKYYQFVDAGSSEEFDSYMQEMASDALYDTGVTAEYGDQLLTLTTCDYHEKNGRFVVVAKKVTAKE